MSHPIIGKSYVTQEYGSTPFARSVTGQRLYKNFGGIHPGTDFGTSGVNAEVVATVPGEIVRATLDGGWGQHIELRGDDGWNRQYAHLSAIFVPFGDIVKEGEILGRVGTTGASTGIHLHFGHRRRKTLGGWEYRDPSVDLKTVPETFLEPSKRLIKAKGFPQIYVWNKRSKYLVPDWETFVFLFGTEVFEELENDIVSKLPEGMAIPSMK